MKDEGRLFLFLVTPNIHFIFFVVRCLGGSLSLDRKKAQSKALPFKNLTI